MPDPSPSDAAPAAGAALTEDDAGYPDWLCCRIGAELKRLRAELGVSAWELGRCGSISDQAVLNNESGMNNTGLKTLARHCQLLGTSLPVVIGRVSAPVAASLAASCLMTGDGGRR